MPNCLLPKDYWLMLKSSLIFHNIKDSCNCSVSMLEALHVLTLEQFEMFPMLPGSEII